jgi:DNA-binding response OmpR family regulator
LATHPGSVRIIDAFAITGKPSTLPKRRTVYVVDDDPSMLRSVRRLLRAHGFQSVPFDTAEALQNNGKFDRAFCIILDINLRTDRASQSCRVIGCK